MRARGARGLAGGATAALKGCSGPQRVLAPAPPDSGAGGVAGALLPAAGESLPPPQRTREGGSGGALEQAAAKLVAEAEGCAVPLPQPSHRVQAAGAAPELRASKWNKGGWGYEDKDISPWARKHLKAKLCGFDIDVPGGHIKVVDVEDLRGEAAIILSRVSDCVLLALCVCVCV